MSLSLEQREAAKVRVEEALDRIRPALQSDGGDAEVVDVTEDGRLILKMLGACGGCPMSHQTLHQGIEKVILRDVPGIRAVETRE